MSIALPAGYVDVGITKSVSISGSLRILMGSGVSAFLFSRRGGIGVSPPFQLNDQTIISGSGCPPGQAEALRKVVLTGPFVGSPVTLIGPTATGCLADPYAFTGDYSLSATAGPYRLGVLVETIDPDFPPPQFWTNYRIRYAWFVDENSTYSSSFAGYSTGTRYAGPPFGGWQASASPGMTPILVPLERIEWGLAGIAFDAGGGPLAVWTSLVIDGVTVDASELNDGHLIGLEGFNADSFEHAAWAEVPTKVHYNLNITKFGGADLTARVLDHWVTEEQLHSVDHTQKGPQADYLTLPYDHTYTIPRTSWETHQKVAPGDFHFDIEPAWAAAQDPPMPADDLRLPLSCSPARSDPTGSSGEPGSYTPLLVSLAGTLDVLLSSNLWVGSPGSDITVTGNTFAVTALGTQLRRNLAEHWRRWTSPGDPLFLITGYELTKHDALPSGAADDVWCWASFPALHLSLTAPAAGTLLLSVEGVRLEVNDPHTTGSDRVTDFSTTEHAQDAYVYSFNVVAGSNDIIIDLNFPSNVLGPVYLERIDQLILTGMKVGTYVLTDGPTLVSVDPLMKVQCGPPVQRGDYSFLWPVVGGTAPLLNWPDQMNKNGSPGTGEIGSYGGALRHVEPLTGSVTETILDFAYTIPEIAARINGWEGWAASYDTAAFNAANKDPFGTALAGELAQWLDPVVPQSALANLKARPRVRSLVIVPGHEFLARVDYPVWGAGEILVGQGGARAPAGIAIDALRTDTNAVVASGVTDGDGFLRLVVPANANRPYLLQVSGATPIAGLPIRHHDIVRFSGQVARDEGFGVDLAATIVGLHRAFRA